MQANKSFRQHFTMDSIKQHYFSKVRTHSSVGLDRITPSSFYSNIDKHIEVIHKKVLKGNYSFTNYRQLLIIKNAEKPPRSICIPTIRDKLTLSLINDMLYDIYGKTCMTPMPQILINKIISRLGKYTHFIKIDIKSFYSSINQEKLLKTIKVNVRKKEIISLIEDAITTPSISVSTKSQFVTRRDKGIPEGLPISNSLANLYMKNIDLKYGNITEIEYFRYVDDILILLNEENFSFIKQMIQKDIDKLALSINEKKDEGKIEKGITYLGYNINPQIISVRESSIIKFEQSLEQLFRDVKKNKIAYIEWKISLKVTGFVINNHKYGWLFFYSQINDLSLLFHLDSLMKKFSKRYLSNDALKFKRFVRAYHEIRQSLKSTKYIPNFDVYTIENKMDVLGDIYGVSVESMTKQEIEERFSHIISREIQEFEKDVQDLS